MEKLKSLKIITNSPRITALSAYLDELLRDKGKPEDTEQFLLWVTQDISTLGDVLIKGHDRHTGQLDSTNKRTEKSST